jgi:hypothetical protein
MTGSLRNLKRAFGVSHTSVSFLSLVCSLLICGCWGGEKTGLVTGLVLLEGEPLPEGRVIFQNKETGRAAVSEISSEGKYRLRAPVGMNSVAVIYEDIGEDVEYGGDTGSVRQEYIPGKSLVPKRYANPRTSPIECEVAEGSQEFEVNMINKESRKAKK